MPRKLSKKQHTFSLNDSLVNPLLLCAIGSTIPHMCSPSYPVLSFRPLLCGSYARPFVLIKHWCTIFPPPFCLSPRLVSWSPIHPPVVKFLPLPLLLLVSMLPRIKPLSFGYSFRPLPLVYGLDEWFPLQPLEFSLHVNFFGVCPSPLGYCFPIPSL